MSEAGEPVTETFAFACGDCGETWERTYALVLSTDPDGLNTQEYVDEDGNAVRSPLAAAVCPACGGRRVYPLTAGLVERASGAEHPPPPEHHHHLRLPHIHHGERDTDTE